jgi:hypothetical protein
VLFQNEVNDRLLAQLSTGFRLLCIGVFTGRNGMQMNDSNSHLEITGEGKRNVLYCAYYNAKNAEYFFFRE